MKKIPKTKKRASIPVSQRCKRCGVKWRNTPQGLCRTCAREADVIQAQAERERKRAEQAAREQRELDALLKSHDVPAPEPEPARREIVVNGVTYLVQFDGT